MRWQLLKQDLDASYLRIFRFLKRHIDVDSRMFTGDNEVRYGCRQRDGLVPSVGSVLWSRHSIFSRTAPHHRDTRWSSKLAASDLLACSLPLPLQIRVPSAEFPPQAIPLNRNRSRSCIMVHELDLTVVGVQRAIGLVIWSVSVLNS